jgi:hypothetical protein
MIRRFGRVNRENDENGVSVCVSAKFIYGDLVMRISLSVEQVQDLKKKNRVNMDTRGGEHITVEW